jgi:hypothetical protein
MFKKDMLLVLVSLNVTELVLEKSTFLVAPSML